MVEEKKTRMFRTQLLALSQSVLFRASGTTAIACDREIPVCVTDVKDIMLLKIE